MIAFYNIDMRRIRNNLDSLRWAVVSFLVLTSYFSLFLFLSSVTFYKNLDSYFKIASYLYFPSATSLTSVTSVALEALFDQYVWWYNFFSLLLNCFCFFFLALKPGSRPPNIVSLFSNCTIFLKTVGCTLLRLPTLISYQPVFRMMKSFFSAKSGKCGWFQIFWYLLMMIFALFIVVFLRIFVRFAIQTSSRWSYYIEYSLTIILLMLNFAVRIMICWL